MTTDEMNKLGKDSMEMAMNSFGAWSKSGQAIVAEIVDYSKKSVEGSAAALGKALGHEKPGKGHGSAERIPEVVLRGFVAEATKLGELYVDFAKEAYKPFESAYAKG